MNDLTSKITNVSAKSTIGASVCRIGLITIGGLVCGWLSGTMISQSNGLDGFSIKWAPGAIFAVGTLFVAWTPGGIAARSRIRRSVVWNLGLLSGITLAYTAAFYAAFYAVMYIEKYVPQSIDLFIGGLAGGAIGATVLVNIWAMLFPCLTKATTQAAMIIVGTVLGGVLAFSPHNSATANWKPTIWLYITWQGGMALGLAIFDNLWRSEFRDHAPVDSDSV